MSDRPTNEELREWSTHKVNGQTTIRSSLAAECLRLREEIIPAERMASLLDDDNVGPGSFNTDDWWVKIFRARDEFRMAGWKEAKA